MHRQLPILFDHPNATRKNYEENHKNRMDVFPGKADNSKLRFIWSIDFLTPSSLAETKKRLLKLGWEDSSKDRESPMDWLSAARNERYRQGWKNLGYITRNPTTFFNQGHHQQSKSLPGIFSSAKVSLFSVSPALSAIVICFVLEENEWKTYDKICGLHLLTEFESRTRLSTSIISPLHQKQRLIKKSRAHFQALIHQWFRVEFPGIFSSKEDSEIPCVEFLELNSSPSPRWGAYRQMFYNARSPSPFSIDDSDEFLFHEDVPISRGSRSYGSLTATSNFIENLDLSLFGDRDNDSLATHFDFYVPAFMVQWGLNRLTHSLNKELGSIRDNSLDPISKMPNLFNKKKSRLDWKISLDVKTLSYDIKKTNFDFFKGNSLNVRGVYYDDENTSHSFLQILNTRTLKAAKEVYRNTNILAKVQHDLDMSYSIRQSAWINTLTLMIGILSIVIALTTLYFVISTPQ
ncbi:MAG: hypothetical protein V7679_10315 [Parasphingorhabdus sp.]